MSFAHLPAADLELVAEQVWPSYVSGDYRVLGSESPPTGWFPVERFSVLGRGKRVSLILPCERSVAARGLKAHPGLRSMPRRAGRIVLALGLASRLIRVRRTITLYSQGAEIPPTVLSQIGHELQIAPAAVMRVRRSANRKALMQILDVNGRTVGYAKIARDARTAAGIQTETRMLQQLAGGTKAVRTPKVILTGELGGLPYLVTEPLPRTLRGMRPGGPPPSIEEFAELMPVSRWAPPARTRHFRGLETRAQMVTSRGLGPGIDDLLQGVRNIGETLPVTSRFHGDFAFWNLGRSSDGRLWCWDFEDATDDALAGMDIVHWHASTRRRSHGAAGLLDFAGILNDAAEALRAVGIGSVRARAALMHTYIAEIALRTLEVVASSGWAGAWCTRNELDLLIDSTLKSDSFT